jgi:hypothetical protein
VGPCADVDVLDRLTRLLRDELLALNIESVEFMRSPDAPGSAKGFGLAEIVSLVGSGALTTVLDAVRGWMACGGGRTATLVVGGDSIELTGLFRDQQQLVEAWLTRAGVSHASDSNG